NMRPEYYAGLCRRLQSNLRAYRDITIYCIAGGASVEDYKWTEALRREASDFMDGLSLHHYVHPGGCWDKGQAVDFSAHEWDVSMEKTLHMDELITKHSEIMDKYDPEKEIGIIIDEWGAWYDVEPGTNPGFLYQQNTIRDAVIAGTHFNIFHNHSDRVQMANIAQMVNVI